MPLLSQTGNPSGFTLVEVIITVAITAVSLVLVLQVFSIGLRSSISSCNYSTAIIHAREKMEELSAEPVQGSGSFDDDFEWEAQVEPFSWLDKDLEETDYTLMKLKVNVTWSESNKKKSFALVTLKTVKTEDE